MSTAHAIVNEELMADVVERWDALLEAQGKEAGSMVSDQSCDDPIQAIAITTGIPVHMTGQMVGYNTLGVLGHAPETEAEVATARAVNGAAIKFLLLGWLVRDQQARAAAAAAEEFDPPAVCDLTQGELAEFRFCPHCGIVRVLHSEDQS